MAKKQRNFPFHPVLFGVYPVIALMAMNIDQIRPETVLRSILVAMIGAALLYGVLYLALRRADKAALLASFWLALFYAYGHIYQAVEGRALFGFVYGKHRYLIAAAVFLFAAGSWWILKKAAGARPLNQILNLVSVFLLVIPAFQIGWFEYRFQKASAQQAEPAAAAEPAASGEDSPDIYYIILDGYSRADVMKDLYDLDITPFMDDLKSIGFVFPECTQSNYGITAFSMFASLNMNYLDAYGGPFPIGSERERVDYLQMRDYLRHSEVRRYLKQQGYQMVTFETGYWWLEIDDAETYIVANNNPLIRYSESYAVSNFEEMLLRTTAFRIFSEANDALFRPLTRRVKTPREHHYDVVKFALDSLDQVPEIPGKKFVYFHILAPHDPFVLSKDGEYVPVGTEADIPGYPDEVAYLNKRIAALVRSLIAQSEVPPIIILQGDHGWDPRYRLEILNAYYLPGGGDQLIYPQITPVNTFRVVLNHYFGGSFDLLEDRSYYSMGSDFPQYGIRSRPYQLKLQPATCMGQPPAR